MKCRICVMSQNNLREIKIDALVIFQEDNFAYVNTIVHNHDFPYHHDLTETLIQKSSCTTYHNWSYVNSNVNPSLRLLMQLFAASALHMLMLHHGTVHSGTPNNVKVPILRESKRAISVLYLKLRDATLFCLWDSSW